MIFLKHDDLKVPSPNAIVWRYLSLEKFLDLLTHRRLYFTNATKLTDKHEITLPPNLIRAKRKELEQVGVSGRDLEEELSIYFWKNSPMANLTLVNCWSLGRDESYALWKIYLGGSRAGVAIRTNISHLRKALLQGGDPEPEDIYIGKVEYTDFVPESEASRVRLVTTKRTFYKYEEELRLFILHHPPTEGRVRPNYDIESGRHFAVDIERLADKLYLSPFMPSWFQDSMRRILREVAPALENRLITSDIRDS